MFRKGKQVILRPLEKEDAPQLKIWMNDPDIMQFLTRVFPVTLREEEEWIENSQKGIPNHVVFGITIHEGTLIGVMGIHNIEWVHGRASTGTVIGDKKFWGKGYGTDAKMLVLDYAFNMLGLRKITSSVHVFNRRSRSYLEKTGYRVVGCLKKNNLRNGKYTDELIVEVFKKDWLPIWRRYKKSL